MAWLQDYMCMHTPVLVTACMHVYRRSGLLISREQGLRYDAGKAVATVDAYTSCQ